MVSKLLALLKINVMALSPKREAKKYEWSLQLLLLDIWNSFLKACFFLFGILISLHFILWFLYNFGKVASFSYFNSSKGWTFVAQLVKNLPVTRKTWVWSQGWEDPLEKGKATYSGILPWRIPWDHKELDTTEWISLSLFKVWMLRKQRNFMWNRGKGSFTQGKFRFICLWKEHGDQTETSFYGPATAWDSFLIIS